MVHDATNTAAAIVRNTVEISKEVAQEIRTRYWERLRPMPGKVKDSEFSKILWELAEAGRTIEAPVKVPRATLRRVVIIDQDAKALVAKAKDAAKVANVISYYSVLDSWLRAALKM